MQRAYAALGLPYSSQAPGQSQQGPGQQAGAQNSQAQQQQQLQQQMRPINALGKAMGKFLVLPMNTLLHFKVLFYEKKMKCNMFNTPKAMTVQVNMTKLTF